MVTAFTALPFRTRRPRLWLLATLASGATFASGTAWAAPADTPTAAAARYEADRAMCLGGQTSQSRDTCLREAAAAYAQAKRGGADDGGDFDANRLQRCQPLPPDLRRACIARMQGQGTTRGSVAGGGIYRELVTVEPGGTAGRDAPR